MGLYIIEPTGARRAGAEVVGVEEALSVDVAEETVEVGIVGFTPAALGVVVGVAFGGMGMGGWPIGVS
jgi:hypothetical protein